MNVDTVDDFSTQTIDPHGFVKTDLSRQALRETQRERYSSLRSRQSVQSPGRDLFLLSINMSLS